ncbi:MAG: type II toxin-antitoxin system VapB family antitoxin [Bacteroidetes bacterium]|nr:type II toxin-antitoxin system VapB family antitoxin [Bacteroidota bacterium]
MRTNIEIDDKLLSQVMEFSGAKTKKEAINEALKFYLYRMALQKLEELRGPGSWEGNLEEMRTVVR